MGESHVFAQRLWPQNAERPERPKGGGRTMCPVAGAVATCLY